MNPSIKWMAITIGIGILLIVIEYRVARRKKEGITPTDKQRMLGILWISILISCLVGAIIWVAD